MKNYKQILEAVNRGIKLALDDFKDDEPNSSLSQHNDIIDSKDVIKQKYDLMKEVVDLGLPSGTLWCKYNLGINQNQLSKAKDWYGDYYAWGELKPNKPEFNWSTYKYAEHYTDLHETDCLTKYCNNPQKGYSQITKTWGFTDNLTELQLEDDAAYQNKKFHNFKFHIPTKEQYEELINYTSNYWVNNYNPNNMEHHTNDDGIKGLNGRVFIGQNGNQLFIPAAGYCSNNIWAIGYACELWSLSLHLNNSDSAYYLYFNSDAIHIRNDKRCVGYPVRPVINL